MNPLTIFGHVDQHHQLSASVPLSVPPGPVTIMIVPSSPADDAEDDWVSVVQESWTDELSDPRQDIYTLDDGEPLDAP
jgi:hypothetical protein